MRVLLSNDDGIGAPGLAVLEKVARQITDDVTVVAPDTNMSATGHSLTLKTPLRLTDRGNNRFSVNGTPTDCVVMAARHIMIEKADYMFSGVNYDSNLAEDITYSGTVAAAMEAALLGIPAIAFSQNVRKDGSIDWGVAEVFAPIVIELIVGKFTFPDHVLLNVNFPSIDPKDVKGILVTRQGTRAIDDHVIMSFDPRGEPYFWIGPAEYRKNEDSRALDTDLGAVNSGYVSITPLSLDMTHCQSLSSLKELKRFS
ncbi:MAG: 5'/3'-nucleotidase SurE [Holosporales bacterium]|jgi:5'-nucleotidase|nr:5'/3'-nucleotidase SurE [Holosporales bacterium]